MENQKIPKDYGNGKIYKIVDISNTMCYYGSTIETLHSRMLKHKAQYKLNTKYYTVFEIFNKYGFENCKIELVENYACNNNKELNKREGYYIKNNVCINRNIAGRTWQERYNDKKAHIKQYYLNNKEKIKNRSKEYYQKNKDKILEKKKLKKLDLNIET